MKRILSFFVAICILSSISLICGCSTSTTDQPDNEDNVNGAQWESELYPGQEAYGISDEMSNTLKAEYKKAANVGKGDQFLEAIMGFGKVATVEETENANGSHQSIYLFLRKVSSPVNAGKEDKQGPINCYQPLILDNAQIFLNGKVANINEIKPGDFASYWGINMDYQPEDIYPQEIRGITLIVALSPDYIGSKIPDATL